MLVSDFLINAKLFGCFSTLTFFNLNINKKIKNPVFYSPGLIAQGGTISDLAKNLEQWHAIIGRAIYEVKDMREAAEEFTKEL